MNAAKNSLLSIQEYISLFYIFIIFDKIKDNADN